MVSVARKVQTIRNVQGEEQLQPEQALADFRSTPAWVLLGEPGAGKSQSLRDEAKATGGHYLTVTELIASDPLPDECRGRILYIDALDEVRAAGSESPLVRVRNQLRRLDNPPFRLACRAADWYGPSDRGQLEGQSPDGQLVALQLCPLSQDDIRQILHDNHGVDDPQTFIERAEHHGIGSLLKNPQTLELLAKAIRGDDWPESRSEVYRLACEKLAHEENREHRDLQKQHRRTASDRKRLQAAGQLFSVLLLSGKSGLASDPDAASAEYPTLEQLASTEPQAAEQALHSKLFTAPGHEERLIPTHRSIAEYLAARWLAEELDAQRLPLQRLLNLLLGADGGVVADLRGLYAWLALHSQHARRRLIDADPLSVILYGDAQPMSLADKRVLLAALQEQARRFPGYRWQGMQSLHPFGALTEEGLVEDFRRVLLAPERDEPSQSHMDCVLEILEQGGASPQLADVLLTVIEDTSRWPRVRHGALDAWLSICRAEQALRLLQRIDRGEVEDADDELAGRLLKYLYPQHIRVGELLQYLHPPKNSEQLGNAIFWDYELPRLTPDEHLPALLDGLGKRPELFDRHRVDGDFSQLADKLLVRGLHAHGDTLTDEQLFEWLGVGADEHGFYQRDREAQQQIGDWLSQRPERYKAILQLCIQIVAHTNRRRCYHRLHGAQAPSEIGLWHLQQANDSEQAVARIHLFSAVHALINQQGAEGLSMEKLEEWAAAHPDRATWLSESLTCDIEGWRLEDAARHSKYEQKRIARRRQRTLDLAPHIESIRSGTAQPGIFEQLAKVWLKRFTDISGETIAKRFASYSEQGDELMRATESGLKQCPLRDDLPTVDEIIGLSLGKRQYLICQPCLLGIELRWQENPTGLQALADDALKRMIAFRLTYPVGETPEWYGWLAQQRPALMAEVLVNYASAAIKAGQSSVSGIYPLQYDESYAEVAKLAAPVLLTVFPLRAKKDQLRLLEHLLKAVLAYTRQSLAELLDSKLALRSLDSAQRAYWLTAALLLDPQRYEVALWRHVGKSTARANLVAEFLSNDLARRIRYSLPPISLGRLVELLTPNAELELKSGIVTDAMRRGDQVRAMIDQLAGMPTPEAAQELERLLSLLGMTKLRPRLESARHQQRLQRREAEYRFLPVESVARILANSEPASVDDLTALTLDLLDDIAHQIRNDNDDGFKAFWNIENRQEKSQREENLCRDTLLTRLRPQLEALGIGIDPEVDHHNDKRADLRLDYRNQFSLPIEIKRDSNSELWTALRKQLIGQYAQAPKSEGYGIYLVLWFGEVAKVCVPNDGGKRPQASEELRARLEAQLAPEERQRIFVRVLDVSRPARR